jgi:7-cyano-7-deazaguanine synthase in queuosine biosynthesis
MTNTDDTSLGRLPHVRIAVLERIARASAPAGSLLCEIGTHIEFTTEKLESYCLSAWEPVIFDTLLVAGAVEYCDRIQKRPAHGWGRHFELTVAVHDPNRWNDPAVVVPLADSLDFLTGDRWEIRFTGRRKPVTAPRQGHFPIPSGTTAVIPFSDGLDSRAVAGIMTRELGDRLIRVRLGSKRFEQPRTGPKRPFASAPYRVRATEKRLVETSARSRGFKFAMVSGPAAYLAGAQRIIVPESGQGALGPALVPMGHGYEDYRNHPLFTDRMDVFLHALFKRSIRFEFPRLWHTKAETLAEFVADAGNASPLDAWSCWQDSRQASVNKQRRQCGICAACMLRRLSLHAAHLEERPDTYVWENLGAPTFEKGAAEGFPKITKAMREYAIAGTLHHDHLAALAKPSADQRRPIRRSAFLLSRSRGLSETAAAAQLERLLKQHAAEWKAFVGSLGPGSFVRQWAAAA